VYQPEQFGNMTRSLLTLMRLAAGETWVEGIPVLLDNGQVNMLPATFIFVYIIVVTWTFLQVSNFSPSKTLMISAASFWAWSFTHA